jgi:hypothetical protein
LSPVIVGTAVAWHDTGRILWLPLLAAILGAAFIQIGTNLFNDVGDFLRGTDTPDRLGPKRATAEGWLSVNGSKPAPGWPSPSPSCAASISSGTAAGRSSSSALPRSPPAGPIPAARRRSPTGRSAKFSSGCFSAWSPSAAAITCRH